MIINYPPYNGDLEVLPLIGTAGSTVFTLVTSGWLDDVEDLPIYYHIGYNTSDDNEFFISAVSEATTYSALLGQGQKFSDYLVTCTVYVMDRHDGSTSTSKNVHVNPPGSSYLLSQAVSDNVKLATDTNNFQLLKQIVSISVISTGNADCTSAPPSYCKDLNRKMHGFRHASQI